MTISYGPVGTVSTTAPATGTTSTGTTNSAGSASPTSGSSTIDQDMFLKLLVAQLKNQDPSSPTDPSAFLSQTAQFSMVQQLTQLGTLSQKVYDASRQQTATSMIGRSATYTDASGTVRTGLVTGVSIGASTPNLTIDGLSISLDSVSMAATPSTTPTTGTTTATTTGTTTSGSTTGG